MFLLLFYLKEDFYAAFVRTELLRRLLMQRQYQMDEIFGWQHIPFGLVYSKVTRHLCLLFSRKSNWGVLACY